MYLEGIKSIVNIGESEMQFQLKKCLCAIAGTNLKINYLDKTTCVIEGEINSVVVK